MIDSMLNLLFRCPHRRLTRPITPVSKPGVPSGDTYVVCLDCGKQFVYDWDRMRISHQVEKQSTAGVLDPNMPNPRGSGLKWGLVASAIPLAMLLGRAFGSKKSPKALDQPKDRS